MEMPEGWKKRKAQIDSIPEPEEIKKMSEIVTGTALFFTQEEIDRQKKMVSDENKILDLMKEMAEVLEWADSALKSELAIEIIDSESKSFRLVEIRKISEILKKFKEWK